MRSIVDFFKRWFFLHKTGETLMIGPSSVMIIPRDELLNKGGNMAIKYGKGEVMKKKFEELKIDLGGSFPEKSKAVQNHAFFLGYSWGGGHYQNSNSRYLFFYTSGNIASSRNQGTFKHSLCRSITVEEFFELTPEDVKVKEYKTKSFYRPVVEGVQGARFFQIMVTPSTGMMVSTKGEPVLEEQNVQLLGTPVMKADVDDDGVVDWDTARDLRI